MQCIYCLDDKPASSFTKREHVIPQAFGKFEPDNMVLRNCVCDECNQYFGNNIELFWGRDSFDSIVRLEYTKKFKEPMKNRRRVKSKIAEGAYKNFIVNEVYKNERGNIAIEIICQVGLYNKSISEYEYFDINEINLEKIDDKFIISNIYPIKLIADNQEDIDLIQKKLDACKIYYREVINVSQSQGTIFSINTNLIIDRTIMRGYCKTAFNYLTYITDANFILKSDFDKIRLFIRYDESNDSINFFRPNLPPILYDDQLFKNYGIRVTDGHLITAGWHNYEKLISKISLNNFLTYDIILCERFTGIWRPISSGHHFDMESRKISKLSIAPKYLMI